jgi:hypothetical protein
MFSDFKSARRRRNECSSSDLQPGPIPDSERRKHVYRRADQLPPYHFPQLVRHFYVGTCYK